MADETASGTMAQTRENPWRTPKRWLVAVALPGLALAVVLATALALYVRRDTGGMGPWPGPRDDPRAVLPPDVPALGFHLLATTEASAYGLWADGHYDTGVVAFYGVGQDTVTAAWALRYRTMDEAEQDFEWSETWFERAADPGLFSSGGFDVPGAAVRSKGTPRLAEVTCRHRNWIVAVWADGRYGVAPGKVTRAVRDAITASWKSRAAAPSR